MLTSETNVLFAIDLQIIWTLILDILETISQN